MTGISTAGIVFFTLGVCSAVTSTLLAHREVLEVNRKKPADQRFEVSFIYPGKMQSIASAYKRLYPSGSVNSWRLAFQISMFVFLALAALFAGFLH